MSFITDVKQANFISSEDLQKWNLVVFGVGSIGANLVRQAALVGFKNITVYDYDIVEEENIGSQEYVKEHIGMKKVDALAKMMNDWYDFHITSIDTKIDEYTEIVPQENTIYFCGVDSLEARKMIWNKLRMFPIVWVETRIGLDNQRFYVVDLRRKYVEFLADYEQSLDPSGPRSELLCGEKGCYPSNVELVSKVVRQLVNIAENKPVTNVMISIWGTPPVIFSSRR